MWGSCRRKNKNEGDNKPRTHKKPKRTGYQPCPAQALGFQGGHEAGQAAPQRLRSTIFPFGLKAEFLAHQNRRPPPSFADASARSCLAGAGSARPTSFEPHPRDRRHEPKARGDGKRNEAMNTIAEFTIIGRVGEIRQVGTTLRVNIASSYSRKDNRGEWVERTRWNEVTVFGESSRGYIRRNIVKGDLVFTSGSMGQTKWEKDGETFYGVTLAAERIERLCKGPNHGDDKNDEPQERSSGPTDDSDIPF
jgi:single-strand DNA-binding protein